jgi:transcriptional regulator with XRE-family HTH domain
MANWTPLTHNLAKDEGLMSTKLGELIRSKRELRKLSVRQAAELVGTNPSYLYELEQGKTVNIRLPLAAKLSQVLKVPLNALAAAALAGESKKAVTAKRRKRPVR